MGSSGRLTNVRDINLAMAVWLAADEYNPGIDIPDYVEGEDIISVTTLMKPTRQFVLAQRVSLAVQEQDNDVSDLIASRLGQAIHGSIESAWKDRFARAMKRLGYPTKVIEKIRINPPVNEPDTIQVFLENRHYRRFDGVIITGQYDMIINGSIHDTKTTSVYTWVNNSKEEDYRIQLSLYRWLNPSKVTSEIAYINHIFTDWQKSMARQFPDTYPQSRLQEFRIELMSLSDTEAWIRRKFKEIRDNVSREQDQSMIRCSDKDLWRGADRYRYFSDPAKAKVPGAKSSKNFDLLQDALQHKNEKGKGVIVKAPSQVKACGYCPAFEICKQKDEYIDA